MAEPAQAVLVVAPYRQDARVLANMLSAHGFEPRICSKQNALALELGSDPPPIVLTQEGLTTGLSDLLHAYLAAQDGWSELPVILLLERQQQIAPTAAKLRASLPRAKVTFLQRPVRTVELISAVQTAVAARRRQLEVRDHIELQQEMQRELNHRVKNALSNVLAVYHLTKRQSTDLESFAESFEGRLMALSRVHAALVATSGERDLGDIAQVVLAPYGGRIAIDGPPAALSQSSAVTFALCLHELATNAGKYGSLSSPKGSVRLEWTLTTDGGDSLARLTWQERGGPPVKAPERRGYGTAFIASAVKGSMHGSVEFDFAATGLTCRMLLPVISPTSATAVAA